MRVILLSQEGKRLTISRFEYNLSMFMAYAKCKYSVVKKRVVYEAIYAGHKACNMIEIEVPDECVEKIREMEYVEVFTEAVRDE